jgi:NOL1/NOP2/sun family putative RNA methylase
LETGENRPAGLPIPAKFLDRMQILLGDEFSAFLGTYDQPASVGLRVNTLKLLPGAFQALSPFPLSPIPWSSAGFECCSAISITGAAQPGKHPYHAAGLYYLQEPSAMAVAELLDPQPGERVLDLSAAPGGKSTHLLALMQNEGLLVANEIHPRRAWELAENLERWGARNVAITSATPRQLADHFGAFFDKVLVDAPCSGEGMFRKSEAARRDWSPELVHSCALRQGDILDEARRLVRPGGKLAYSTCTFAPEENENAIAGFLKKYLEFELLEIPFRPGFSQGRPEWAEMGQSLPELRNTVRLWPHLASGEGHFIALLRKKGTPDRENLPARRASAIDKPTLRLLQDFCEANLAGDESCARSLTNVAISAHLFVSGSYLYVLPPGLPDLTGLKVIHPGWWLGTVKKERFEPSHALALGLKASQARRALRLELDDPQCKAYLRGETLENQGEEGWVLVTVGDFTLGWGKRVQGRVKNYYPHGLRWY